MEAARIKMTLTRAKFHARILWRGFFKNRLWGVDCRIDCDGDLWICFSAE